MINETSHANFTESVMLYHPKPGHHGHKLSCTATNEHIIQNNVLEDSVQLEIFCKYTTTNTNGYKSVLKFNYRISVIQECVVTSVQLFWFTYEKSFETLTKVDLHTEIVRLGSVIGQRKNAKKYEPDPKN